MRIRKGGKVMSPVIRILIMAAVTANNVYTVTTVLRNAKHNYKVRKELSQRIEQNLKDLHTSKMAENPD